MNTVFFEKVGMAENIQFNDIYEINTDIDKFNWALELIGEANITHATLKCANHFMVIDNAYCNGGVIHSSRYSGYAEYTTFYNATNMNGHFVRCEFFNIQHYVTQDYYNLVLTGVFENCKFKSITMNVPLLIDCQVQQFKEVKTVILPIQI